MSNHYTDTELIDALQKMLEEKKYTGKVILRDSSCGRGWRLHETSGEGAVDNVRDAIANYIDENRLDINSDPCEGCSHQGGNKIEDVYNCDRCADGSHWCKI